MQRWLNISKQETNVIDVVAEINSDDSGLFDNNSHINTASSLTNKNNEAPEIQVNRKNNKGGPSVGLPYILKTQLLISHIHTKAAEQRPKEK